MSSSDRFPDDDAALIAALQCANLPTLLMVMIHLTGDPSWLRDELRPKRANPQRLDGGYSPELAASLRAQALEVLIGDTVPSTKLPVSAWRL